MPIGPTLGSIVGNSMANTLNSCSPVGTTSRRAGHTVAPFSGPPINSSSQARCGDLHTDGMGSVWYYDGSKWVSLGGGANYNAGAFTGLGGCSGISGMPSAMPEMRDPFEYACEVASKQPADKKWRRFQHALFQVDDVVEVAAEGSGSIVVQIHLCGTAVRQEIFTLPFQCGDPVQWFAEHVMQMEFPNAKHAT